MTSTSSRLAVRRTALLLAVPCFAVALLIWAATASWGLGGPTSIDESWADVVRAGRSSVLTSLALALDFFGGTRISGIVVPAVAALWLVLRRRPWAAFYLITASAASALFVKLIKITAGRSRPEDVLVTTDFGSFPSGHSANAAVIVTVMAILFPRHRWIPVGGGCYVVLMMLSRTYLSAHWITDTIAGALLGFSAAMIVWTIFAARLQTERIQAERIQAERLQAER